jgi:hypothetical protein
LCVCIKCSVMLNYVVFLIVGVRSKIQKILADLPTHAGPLCSFYLSQICVVPIVPILVSSPQVFVKWIFQVLCLVWNNWPITCEFSVDRCTSIAECHQVYYNAVLNESIIVPGYHVWQHLNDEIRMSFALLHISTLFL